MWTACNQTRAFSGWAGILIQIWWVRSMSGVFHTCSMFPTTHFQHLNKCEMHRNLREVRELWISNEQHLSRTGTYWSPDISKKTYITITRFSVCLLDEIAMLMAWEFTETGCTDIKGKFLIIDPEGIVKLKIKILLSFAHLHIVPNLYTVGFSAEHEIWIFWWIFPYIKSLW